MAHVLLIALLNTRVSVPVAKTPPDKPVIHTRLVTYPVNSSNDQQTKEQEPNQVTELDEQQQENLQKTNDEPEKKEESEEVPVVDQQISPEDVIEEDVKIDEDVANNTQQNTTPSATSMIQRQLGRLKAQSDQTFIQQELDEYTATRSFSVMHKQPNNVITPSKAPEVHPVIPKVNVDCTNTMAQITTIVAGLFGGRTLTCSSSPALTPFLEERLQKRGLTLDKVKKRKKE